MEDAACPGSLAYLDTEYESPEMQQLVHSLIEQEMETFPPKDYLADRPMPKLRFTKGSAMEIEMARVMKGREMPPLDTTRYEARAPDQKDAKSLSAWRDAVNNAKAQLEHQNARLMNLELLGSFGTQMWLPYNKTLEAMGAQAAAQLEKSQADAEAINVKRKVSQDAVARDLWVAATKRYETSEGNLSIAVACAQLEQENKRLKASKAEAASA